MNHEIGKYEVWVVLNDGKSLFFDEIERIIFWQDYVHLIKEYPGHPEKKIINHFCINEFKEVWVDNALWINNNMKFNKKP